MLSSYVVLILLHEHSTMIRAPHKQVLTSQCSSALCFNSTESRDCNLLFIPISDITTLVALFDACDIHVCWKMSELLSFLL